MASKPHPLDIFRSSEQGFNAASRSPRKRRTVSGKVVRSVARASAPGAKHSAPTRPAPRAKARGAATTRASTARGRNTPLVSNRVLLWTAMVVVGALGLWLAFGPDAAPDVPTLKVPGDGFEQLFSARTEAPAEASAPAATTPADSEASKAAPPLVGSSDFTILAATYAGSAVSTAQAAAAELDARGFAGVTLVGHPAEDGSGGDFGRVELIVGRASSRDGLTDQLVQLRSIHDWGTGREASPFHDARLVAHPLADG